MDPFPREQPGGGIEQGEGELARLGHGHVEAIGVDPPSAVAQTQVLAACEQRLGVRGQVDLGNQVDLDAMGSVDEAIDVCGGPGVLSGEILETGQGHADPVGVAEMKVEGREPELRQPPDQTDHAVDAEGLASDVEAQADVRHRAPPRGARRNGTMGRRTTRPFDACTVPTIA